MKEPSFCVRLGPAVLEQLDELARRRARYEGDVVPRATVIREAIAKLAAAELGAEGARRSTGAPKRASTTRASSAGRVRRAAGG